VGDLGTSYNGKLNSARLWPNFIPLRSGMFNKFIFLFININYKFLYFIQELITIKFQNFNFVLFELDIVSTIV